jgi:hypothetical protein
VSWWDELRRAAEAFAEQHGLAAAFLFLLVEEAGVPLPVPGDGLMLVLGVQAREGGPWLLAVAVPAFALAGVGWGAIYASWNEPRLRLPDWLSGLQFAAVPLATSLLVVVPALGLRHAELDARIVVAAGEAVRHAVYRAVLGLT